MSADPALYTFINQGVLTVDGMSDVDEMKLTDVSSDSLLLLLYTLLKIIKGPRF